VHKVHIHIQRKWSWDNCTSLKHNKLAIASGTPDCPVPWLEHSANWLLLGFLSAPPLTITRLSGETTSNGQLRPTVDCATARVVCTARSQNTFCDDRSHRTVRCSKRTDDFNGQPLKTPTIGWRDTHRTMNSRVSGAPPDCPVCPSIEHPTNG
jgi:hypothetical protein